MTNPIDKIIETGTYNGKPVRVVGSKEAPLFVANDLLKAFGYSGETANTLKFLEWGEKVKVPVKCGNQTQNMIALTEPGLYGLIMSSRKPAVKPLRDWIMHALKEENVWRQITYEMV